VVSLRLALSNPTLPEITDGYEIQLHHSMGHDRLLGPMRCSGHRICIARMDGPVWNEWIVSRSSNWPLICPKLWNDGRVGRKNDCLSQRL